MISLTRELLNSKHKEKADFCCREQGDIGKDGKEPLEQCVVGNFLLFQRGSF